MLTKKIDQPSSLCAILRGAFLLVYICLGCHASAQGFRSTSSYTSNTQQSEVRQKQEHAYRPYQSTVYEPFATAAPSSYNSDGSSQISNRRNAWGGGGMGDEEGDDAGYKDPNSPVGEPWGMLFFALIAAAIVAKKRKIENA